MKTENTLNFINNAKLICKNNNVLIIFELENEEKTFCISFPKSFVLKVIGSSLKKKYLKEVA